MKEHFETVEAFTLLRLIDAENNIIDANKAREAEQALSKIRVGYKQLQAELAEVTKDRDCHSRVRQRHLVRNFKAGDKIAELESQAVHLQQMKSVADELQADKEILVKCNSDLVAKCNKHRWIPVSERLPKKGGQKNISDLILMTDGPTVNIGWYDYAPNMLKWDGWSVPLSKRMGAVTHWMPIPKRED